MDAKQKDNERKDAKDRMAEKRRKMTEEERKLELEKNRLRNRKRREQKKEEQKKDLKRRKKAGEFAHKGEYLLAKDKRFTEFGRSKATYAYHNEYEKHKKKMWRKGRCEVEIEFDKIDTLLMMRKKRQRRNGKEHLLDNLDATKGMRILKMYGPLKGRDFMRRKAREKDEEVLWKMFWDKGQKYKDILENSKPDVADMLKEKEEIARKEKAKRDKIEKDLDAKGRWNWDNGLDDYVWSLPDEHGHHVSLYEYNKEYEWVSPTNEEILRIARENRDPEEEAMRDKEYEEYRQILREINDPEGEERRRKRKEKKEKLQEEMAKPISMPIQGEKSEYERVRDNTIRERHLAMKESGMFDAKELDKILTCKIYD